MRNIVSALVLAMLACGSARAQELLANPGFDTAALAPWTVTNTAQGGSIVSTVANADLDGAGPGTTSLAASLMVGQAVTGTGAQGVVISQQVNLSEGGRYWVRFDWGARAFVNAYNSSAGRFELFVDGQAMPGAFAQAPVLAPNTTANGSVRALILGTASRPFAIGARVTRTVLRGEEVFQYLDNFSVRPACIGDFNASGSVSVEDIFAFLAAYFANSIDADVDFSGAISVQDVFTFLAAYFAGCN